MNFLVAHRHVLDGDDDRLKLFFRLLKLWMRFYDLLERRDLLFRLARFAESGDQFVSMRYAFAADWIGSVFFAGREKAPLALSAFFVDSHQRFHSVSVKTSPTIHSWICSAVAFP